jgi:DUF4097 and DUF4098 domain-containing protein YvlB
MVSADERLKILKMVEEGKITPEEGTKLLAALRESRKEPSSTGSPARSLNKGWLRVRVTDTATGRTKVNVNLPLGLIDAGMNIATQFAPDVNFGQIADAVRSGEMQGKIVDVYDEDGGEHVEIFVD